MSVRISDGAAAPVSGKRQRRCVVSASTRMTEIVDPSGVSVGEYSDSCVSVTCRSPCGSSVIS
jgi:hypothetical protein